MTAHVAMPRITGDPTLPATLSKTVLTGTLRERMGFDGIVMTDGLEMQGIVKRFGSGRAAVLAVLAGADMPMILWTHEVKEEVYQSILRAVRQGEISGPRLAESVRRILRVKVRRGLFARRQPDAEDVVASHNENPVHEKVAQEIARNAITLVRNHGGVLPLSAARYRRIVVMTPPGSFGNRLAQEPGIEVITVPFVPSRESRASYVAAVYRAARRADILVASFANRYHLGMLKEVTARIPQLPVAAVSFGSPYYLSRIPDVDAYVCTYSYLDVAQRAAAEALLGRTPMGGKLPVTIPGFYAYGHGEQSSGAAIVGARAPRARESQNSL
jgi:beta-N-acetylhexosaminidase